MRMCIYVYMYVYVLMKESIIMHYSNSDALFRIINTALPSIAAEKGTSGFELYVDCLEECIS